MGYSGTMAWIEQVRQRVTEWRLGPIDSDTADDILAGVLIPVGTMDPKAAMPCFTYGDREYVVIDSYCLNPECGCTDVGLSFVRVGTGTDGDGAPGSSREVFCLFWNHENKDISVELSRIPDSLRRRLWNAFLEQYGDDMFVVYGKRHAEYRRLVEKWLPKVLRRRKKGLDAKDEPGDDGDAFDLHPSLRAVVDEAGLNVARLSVSLCVSGDGKTTAGDRHDIMLYDGDISATWRVDSLTGLFRGDAAAPDSMEMKFYPDEYHSFFFDIESNLVMLADLDLPPTDQQFVEAYSTVRRRPNGKSVSSLHDMVWQCTCLALALQPWSAKECEAVLAQLARSARSFRMGASSRNYMAYLKQ